MATYEKTKTHSDSEWRDKTAQKRPCQFLLAFDGMRAVGMVGGTIDKQHEFTVVAMWLYENYRGNSVADLLISSLQNMQQTKVIQKLYFVLN
ncbi:GNAT family N-acetyltransferase [Acinetobacter sp. YH12085]|uniref:GNAT family N-acetyltransferase n=1 Tax=unclassified Acinetobacter TaxID=196816 RepID=UPI00359FA238